MSGGKVLRIGEAFLSYDNPNISSCLLVSIIWWQPCWKILFRDFSQTNWTQGLFMENTCIISSNHNMGFCFFHRKLEHLITQTNLFNFCTFETSSWLVETWNPRYMVNQNSYRYWFINTYKIKYILRLVSSHHCVTVTILWLLYTIALFIWCLL